MHTNPVHAVLWDFGGVIFDSPFDNFARYEASAGLPKDLIRRLNATNPDTNAWARFERSEVDPPGFCEIFEAEALQAGYLVDGRAVLASISGGIRPQMVRAIETIRAHGFRTAGLTNNVSTAREGESAERHDRIRPLFDVIIESSVVGVRKPEQRFYELACEALQVQASACVFLDDLGINLKPAAAMGMRTIKVVDPDVALDELSTVLGISLP